VKLSVIGKPDAGFPPGSPDGDRRLSMSEEVKLDWSSAEVHEGKLVIALEGEQPDGWADVFERTANLLNQGTWDKIKLKKGEVRIKPVGPGEEERVRHFLESVVLEANSATAPGDVDARDGDANRSRGTEASSEDQQATERLRSYAETPRS
jgi:hypothetical protein